MKHYVETSHDQINLKAIEDEVNFIQFNQLNFEIHGTHEYTCPVECMAVFAHDSDIDYPNIINEEQSCKIIKLFDGCKSVKHVEILR